MEVELNRLKELESKKLIKKFNREVELNSLKELKLNKRENFKKEKKIRKFENGNIFLCQ